MITYQIYQRPTATIGYLPRLKYESLFDQSIGFERFLRVPGATRCFQLQCILQVSLQSWELFVRDCCDVIDWVEEGAVSLRCGVMLLLAAFVRSLCGR